MSDGDVSPVGYKLTGAAFLAACCTFALTGCASLPSKHVLAAPTPVDRYASAQSFAAPVQDWPSDRWWIGYGDPQLSALIDEALRTAPDMREAQARLDRADAVAQAAGAKLLPSVDASAAVQESRQSYNQGIPAEFIPHGWNGTGRARLSFSWEIDFWGKNRAALAAATSEAKAAAAEAAAARLQLSVAVASAYTDLAGEFADLDAANKALSVRRQTAALMRQRSANGLENQGAVQRADSSRASAEANVAQINEMIGLTRNRIAALIGAGPDRGLAIAQPAMPALKAFGLPANLPAELIGRRPDVIAARLRAEAASQKIKEAKASFYPNVNISAFIGVESLGLSTLLKSSSTVGGVGPAISLPIFDGGRLRANYRGAEADYGLAVAQYDDTVQTSLHDVADAATSARALSLRITKTREAEQDATRAWEVARNRYQGGLATYLDVLTAEDALITSRQAVAALQTRGFALDVALVRALGGGFRS